LLPCEPFARRLSQTVMEDKGMAEFGLDHPDHDTYRGVPPNHRFQGFPQ
jgi:hypothetical protein